jgi:hypothetical protein
MSTTVMEQVQFEGSRTAKAQFRAQAKKKISALQFGILYYGPFGLTIEYTSDQFLTGQAKIS